MKEGQLETELWVYKEHYIWGTAVNEPGMAKIQEYNCLAF